MKSKSKVKLYRISTYYFHINMLNETQNSTKKIRQIYCVQISLKFPPTQDEFLALNTYQMLILLKLLNIDICIAPSYKAHS